MYLISRFILLVMLALISIQCARYQPITGISPILEEFNQQYHMSVSNLPIYYVDYFSTEDVVAECQLDPFTRRIAILKPHFKTLSYIDRKILIFHELGHCVFNRGHNEFTYPDGCPKSLMHPYTVSSACFLAHEQELLKELPVNPTL